MVNGQYGKVKSRLHHKVAHLQPLTNVPTKFQLPTPHYFQDIAGIRCSNLRSLQQGQRSKQGHIVGLHTYTPNQCPYQVSTSYTLRFLRYSPDKLYRHSRDSFCMFITEKYTGKNLNQISFFVVVTFVI